MNDLYLDPLTHDLSIVNLDASIVKGADRVRQQIDVKLKLWTGEWFLDTEFGTPYLEDVLGKRISLNGANAAIKRSIMEVNDVNGITAFNSRYSSRDRKLTIDFTCSTPFGLIRITR